MIRDSRKSLVHWDNHISILNDVMKEHQRFIDSISLSHGSATRYALYLNRMDFIISRYSRGDDFDSIAKDYPSVVDALESYYGPPTSEQFSFDQLDAYIQDLWLVSLGVLLNQQEAIMKRVILIIDNFGKDAVFDRLAT